MKNHLKFVQFYFAENLVEKKQSSGNFLEIFAENLKILGVILS